MKQVIIPPFRFGLPPVIHCTKKTTVAWEVVFPSGFPYEVEGGSMVAQQHDILKILGLSAWFWNRRKDSIMLGGRWNPESEMVELFAYYHIEGEQANSDILHEVTIDETIIAIIDIDDNYTLSLYNEDSAMLAMFSTPAFFHNKGRHYEIGFYFGGDLPVRKSCVMKSRIDGFSEGE